MNNYQLIRSKRKTLSVEVNEAGRVIVRAPLRMPLIMIEAFLSARSAWIGKAVEKQQKKNAAAVHVGSKDLAFLRKQAKAVLPDRIAYFAERMGLEAPPFRVTSARTRYGSCSPKNCLSFSLFLMVNSPDAIDYVVVHELAHIRNKNHGPRFWAEVASILPDWKARKKTLFMPVLDSADSENPSACLHNTPF